MTLQFGQLQLHMLRFDDITWQLLKKTPGGTKSGANRMSLNLKFDGPVQMQPLQLPQSQPLLLALAR